jgi:hypothetical protein
MELRAMQHDIDHPFGALLADPRGRVIEKSDNTFTASAGNRTTGWYIGWGLYIGGKAMRPLREISS